MEWYENKDNFPCIIQSINSGSMRISYGVRDDCHRDSTDPYSKNIGRVSNMLRAHPGHKPVAQLMQRAFDAPETFFQKMDEREEKNPSRFSGGI